MFHHVAQQQGEDDEDDEEDDEQLKPKVALKNKIQFVSKMLKMQKLLRQENENILKIKAANNNKLPQGILLEGKEALETFTDVKIQDYKNEMRPDD